MKKRNIPCLIACAAALPAMADMPAEVRASVDDIVVLGRTAPAGKQITGSYDEETSGFAGGMNEGARLGRGVQMQVGHIPVSIPIPILTVPGAVLGAAKGAAEEQLQDLRDAMTKDLANAEGPSLTTDAFAMDVFWNLRDVDGLNSKVLALDKPIPAETDAVLYVSLKQLEINVDDSDAILTTSATATLRRVSDGIDLYTAEVSYEDRDSLKNWTKNDNALWRNYANFARHFIGREVAADLFDRIDVKHGLTPAASATNKNVKRNVWQQTTKKLSPTLAWTVPEGAEVTRSPVSYDVEIYDAQRMVYAARNLPGTEHALTQPLEACKKYRWTVQPTFSVNNVYKTADPMRKGGAAGNVGRRASVAQAYVQDFAMLEVKCGSK